MANHTNVTDATFDAEVIKSDLLVIVDFQAAWCVPCRKIAPILNELADDYDGQVKLTKLDIDSNPTVTSAYSVLNLPTVMMFKNGQPVETLTGTSPKAKYEAAIKPYLLPVEG
ncbi:MAG: thioredoxin [Chloroflexota bacterium]